jgi:hypothetical protein
VTYLEYGVEDGGCRGREDEVRVAQSQVGEPQEAVVVHARHGKRAHGAEEAEGTESDPPLNDHEAAHGEDAARVRLQDLGLLHLVDVLLLLVAPGNRRLHLLLKGPCDGLQRGHGGHFVGAERLEKEGGAPHADRGGHDGAGPAPARLQVELLDHLLEDGRHAPAVFEAHLLQLPGMVDERRRVELGLRYRRGLGAEEVLNRLGVVECGIGVGVGGRSRCLGAVHDRRLVDAGGRKLRRLRGDDSVGVGVDAMGRSIIYKLGDGNLFCSGRRIGGGCALAPAPGRIPRPVADRRCAEPYPRATRRACRPPSRPQRAPSTWRRAEAGGAGKRRVLSSQLDDGFDSGMRRRAEMG